MADKSEADIWEQVHKECALKALLAFTDALNTIVNSGDDKCVQGLEDVREWLEIINIEPELLLDGIFLLSEGYERAEEDLETAFEVIKSHEAYEQKLLEIIKGKYPNLKMLMIGGE